jgi:hypothetical protein
MHHEENKSVPSYLSRHPAAHVHPHTHGRGARNYCFINSWVTNGWADNAQTWVYNTQMLSRILTITDVCRVTSRTRYELRGLLEGALAEKPTKGPRVAREFTSHELLVIAILTELEDQLAIKRSQVVAISKRLSQALSGPREVNREARLVITFSPPSVSYVSSAVDVKDAVVLGLGRIFERVDRYIADGVLPSNQPPLQVRPEAAPKQRTRVQRG